MRCTIEDLDRLAEVLRSVRQFKGARIETLTVGSHTITLEWVFDQKDGDYFVVTNIGSPGKPSPVMRQPSPAQEAFEADVEKIFPSGGATRSFH